MFVFTWLWRASVVETGASCHNCQLQSLCEKNVIRIIVSTYTLNVLFVLIKCSIFSRLLGFACIYGETGVSYNNYQVKTVFCVMNVMRVISVNIYIRCIIRINKMYYTNDIPYYC